MRFCLWGSLILCLIAKAEFNYLQLQSLINEKKLTSIESVLEELPEDFRTQYVLLKKSSAFQVASLERPRIVLYNDVMTLTIATDETHPTFYEMEVLNFIPERNEYELHVVDFKNNSVQFSEKNPQTCTACHGQNPKPLWESHMKWSHAFMPHSNQLSYDEVIALRSHVLKTHPRTQVFLDSDKNWTAYTQTQNPAEHLTQHYTKQYAQHVARKILLNPAHIQYPDLSLKILKNDHAQMNTFERELFENQLLRALEKLYPQHFSLLFEQYLTTTPTYQYSVLRAMFYDGIDYYNDILSLSFLSKFDLDFYDGENELLFRIYSELNN